MASYLKPIIRKFIRVNHFSAKIYLASSFIRQYNVAIAVEYLMVVIANLT